MPLDDIDAAVEKMRAAREPAQEVQDVQEEDIPELEEEIPAEPDVEEVAPPEEASEEDSEEVAEEDDPFADELDEDFNQSTLDAPAAFSKEAKELFAQAGPELQKAISERLKAAEGGASRKVQEAIQKQKEAEQLAEEVAKMRDDYMQRLSSLDVNLPEPPDPDLIDPNSDSYDPDAFYAQQARYERAKRAADKTDADRRKLAEENQKIQQQKMQEAYKYNAERLLQVFPSWNDGKKFQDGVSNIRQYLVSQGINEQVAQRVYDADMIKIAYKAMRYDHIKQARKQPAPPKTKQPSGRGTRTPRQATASKARTNHKQAGTVESAAELLRATRQRGVA